MKNRVAVLLSTYNGEKYLAEQLDSLMRQKGVYLDIYIRDDGSRDETIKIIEQYKAKNKNIYFEKNSRNVGYAKSFWNLLKSVDDKYDYYAFCDQDDIWGDEKIISAIKMLERYDNTPALYTSRVVSVDNAMNVIDSNTFKTSGTLNRYESFQKSSIPGCVFVFNNRAKVLLSKYDGFMESHDWAAYAIVNSFGKVVYDNHSYISYRIHGDNAIGKSNRVSVLFTRIKRFFRKSKCVRSKFAKDFFETYGSSIDDAYFKQDIEALAYYKKSIKNKKRLIFGRHFKGIIFKIYIILNRV